MLLVWQEREHNEWATAFRRTLTDTNPAPSGPDAFSLADPVVTEQILTAAGFIDVDFTDVHEPVYYGPDTAAAYDAVLRLLKFEDQLAELDDAEADRVRSRLWATLDAHNTDRGVCFDSRAWIVTARRAG